MNSFELLNILKNATANLRKDVLEISSLQGSFRSSEVSYTANSYREVAHKIVFEVAKKINIFDLVFSGEISDIGLNLDECLKGGTKFNEMFKNIDSTEDGYFVKLGDDDDYENKIKILVSPISGVLNMCRSIEFISSSVLVQELVDGKWITRVCGIYYPFTEDYLSYDRSGFAINQKISKSLHKSSSTPLIFSNKQEFESSIYVNNFSFALLWFVKNKVDKICVDNVKDISTILCELELFRLSGFKTKLTKSKNNSICIEV